MRIETYTIGIEFDSKSVGKGLDKIDKQISKRGKKAGKKFGKGFGEGFGSNNSFDAAGGGRRGGGGLGGGLGLGGALGLSRLIPAVSVGVIGSRFIDTITDIEAATVGVGKTTGLAADELEKLKDKLLQVGTEVAVPTENLFTIAQVAGQLGIQGVQGITKFTEAFAKLEIASDRTVSGEFGAQTFAKFLDLSGAGIGAAENIASALTFLGNTSKTTEGKILKTAQEIAKGTALFNLGAGPILGLATTFDEIGIESEVAGSAAFKFFSKVNTAAKTGEGIGEFLEITKLTSEEFKRLAEQNPTEILQRFSVGLKALDDAGKDVNETLGDFGLQELRVSKALSSLAQKNENLKLKIAAANLEIENNLALTKEVTAAQKSSAAATILMNNAFTKLSESIGVLVLPALTSVKTAIANEVSQTADRIKGVTDGNISITRAIFDPTPFDDPDQGFFSTLGENIGQNRSPFRSLEEKQPPSNTTNIQIDNIISNAENGQALIDDLVANDIEASPLPAGVP